jgi:predicted signal transduction protein with EAL and GGDEF domain
MTRAQMQALATDSLTGLPNARAIREILERALADRTTAQTVTCVTIGVERRGEASASAAQQTDELQTIVAERLRRAQPSGATLGSLGGARFAAVLVGERLGTDMAAARTMLSALAQPLHLHGERIDLVGHAGVVSAPEHGGTGAEMLRRADLALEAACQGPRGRVLAFDIAMERAHDECQALERDLKRAVAARAFDVEYQPVVAAEGYRIVGVEALLRWNDPRRGTIPPTTFIPLAEKLGLMDDLGDFVLRQALADAKRWPQLYVAVNLSPVQLRDGLRAERIATALRDSAFDCRRVVLEITESVLIEEPDRIKTHLEMLRRLGCRIALDDFGAGYSSLAYLRQLTIDKLKIDKGFVAPLGRAGNAGVIIQAMVALGRALGLSVLVEGVETEEHRVLLRLAGCDEMQGFLFAKPVPAEDIARMLAAAAPPPGERMAVRSA